MKRFVSKCAAKIGFSVLLTKTQVSQFSSWGKGKEIVI
jgi:hypothetical protein